VEVNAEMIKVGMSLTLEVETDSDTTKRYRCRVVEEKGTLIYIDYPINIQTGRTDYFPKGTFLFAYFVGPDQSVYKFYTEIIERKREKVPMLLLRYDQNKLERIQRREYVRVNATLDVSINDSDENIEPFTTVTKDISGGGIAVVLQNDKEIEPRTQFDLVIVLHSKNEDNDYIFTRAEAIRTYTTNNDSKRILSMKFIDIYENDRQQIIQYCFDKQLEERRQLLEK